jgi:hypothetical protein
MKSPINTLATAIGIEYDQNSDRVLIIFEITDPKFKQQVKEDWTRDIELVITGRSLKEII